MNKKKNPTLKVFFDTNVLFTKSESDLVRRDVHDFLEKHSNHLDIMITWHLPSVVVEERKFQMRSGAKEMLPTLGRLEKLLDHTLGLNERTLELRVDEAINRSIEILNLKVTEVDVGKVDWNDIIKRSTAREHPFEAGKTEKGFRDAMIAQSFLQEQTRSEKTSGSSILALVTEDKLLTAYVREKGKDTSNIRIVDSLEDLEGLINTLASNVPEDYVERMQEKAKSQFFSENDDESLYFKGNIENLVERDFAHIFKTKSKLDRSTLFGDWHINEPNFVKKEGQRVYWSTVIEVEYEVSHIEPYGSTSSLINDDFSSLSLNYGQARVWADRLAHANSGSFEAGVYYPDGFKADRVKIGSKVVDEKGHERFEVLWSGTISSETEEISFSDLTVDEVLYIGKTSV